MKRFAPQQQWTGAEELSFASRLEQSLDAIQMRERLNAFVEVFREDARTQAQMLDARPASDAAPRLAGLLLGVKDNIAIQGKHCTAASSILDGYVSPYDATVIERLRTAGAVLMGRTNMDEFAMGSSGETSVYGPTLHPDFEDRLPGGSSSGSAVAVAAGLVDAALGSDTGGSIRQPAALTGTVGLKPTWGRVSRYGLVSFAPSFEQIGPITRSVDVAAAILEIIAGNDDRDATSAAEAVPYYRAACRRGVRGLRVGLSASWMSGTQGDAAYLREPLREAADALESAGATVCDYVPEYQELVLPVYIVMANVEAASNLARYDGLRFGRGVQAATFEEAVIRGRSEGFGPEVRRRLLQGAWIQGDGLQDEHYQNALSARRLIRDAWLRVFDGVDLLLLPVTAGPPQPRNHADTAAISMRRMDEFTALANVTGFPAISIPVTPSPEGFPRAVQILARPFAEEMLFQAAAVIETAMMQGRNDACFE